MQFRKFVFSWSHFYWMFRLLGFRCCFQCKVSLWQLYNWNGVVCKGGSRVWHHSFVPVCLCTGICTGQHKRAFVLSGTHTRTHTESLSLLTQQVWSWLFVFCASPLLLLTSWKTTTSPVLSSPPALQPRLPSHLDSTFPLLHSSIASPLAELFMEVQCAKWPEHCWYTRIHVMRALCVVLCVCEDWMRMWKSVVRIKEWGKAGYTGIQLKAS